MSLSTASAYPLNCATTFEMAARLGYDGVEVMVWTDPVSQDPDALRRLSEHHGLPIVSLHAPTLLLTQRVWGTDPWPKLRTSCEVAVAAGAGTVVVHPPFRWQREYARGFAIGVAELESEFGVQVAVENMFPWRARGREIMAVPAALGPGATSPTSTSPSTCRTRRRPGSTPWPWPTRSATGWSTCTWPTAPGARRTSTWCRAAATQPCAELLERLAAQGWAGNVVVEVSTRRAVDLAEREADLAEALAFARLNLVAAAT